jgi:hypothetical protein
MLHQTMPESFARMSKDDWLTLHEYLTTAHEGMLKGAAMVDAARGGNHEADYGLRCYIQWAIDYDRFQEMTVSVRAYAGQIIARGT